VKKDYFSLNPFLSHVQLKRPVDWSKEFGRKAPLAVEIGFGIGEYLVRTAKKQPAENFLGIDNSWVSVRRTLRKIAHEDLTNVRLLLTDAQMAFERLIKPRSLARVYSLFPCPWPKKKHMKYRLHSQDFLKVLNNRLVNNGELQMVTDHREYLDWVMEQSKATGFQAAWKEIEPKFDTKYERKWQSKGQSLFYELTLKKKKHLSVPLKEDVALKVYRLKSFCPEHFHPEGENGPRTIIFKGFLYDPKRQKAMVEVITSEENVRQHFWAAITLQKGQWHVYISEGSSVIPTEAVKRALELIHEASVLSCESV